MSEDCFVNLSKLQTLKLSFNSLDFLGKNQNYTKNLKSLNLENNRIEFIQEKNLDMSILAFRIFEKI